MRTSIQNLDAKLLELRGAGFERFSPLSHLVVRKRLGACGRVPVRSILQRHVKADEYDTPSSELDGEIDRMEARMSVTRLEARPHNSRLGR